MGVVYHANYLIWMEVGRVELCRALGMRYRDLEQQAGVVLAVADAHVRYLSPARYDDEIAIATEIAEANPRLVVFRYEIRHQESGRKLAVGETKHIFCAQDMKSCRLPEQFYEVFGIPVRA